MKRRWLVRVVLSVTIGLGVLAGLARAQEPPPVLLMPNSEIPEYLATPRTRLQAWWASLPGHCWSHPNAYLAGNCKSSVMFAFGSSRQFFGEPCLKGPPVSSFVEPVPTSIELPHVAQPMPGGSRCP